MANVVFMDGFDAYDFSKSNTTLPGFHTKWLGNMRDTGGVAGRYGGQAFRLGDSVWSPFVRTYFNDNLYLQTATIAFALFPYYVPNASGHGQFIRLMHGESAQFGMSISDIGEVKIWRGNTMVAASAPNIIKTQDWHYLEMEYVGHTTAGRATVYLDGVEIIDFRGNTQASAPYGFNGLHLNGGNVSSFCYDDMYVIDEATRIGERRIETLRPNGDISGNQFLPSTGSTGFNMLDDEFVSVDDFVSATALGAKDLFNFTNLTTTPNKIDAIQLNVWATKTDAETRQMRTLVKSGSVETESGDYNLPTNHLNMNRIENKDPATNEPWTPAGVNAVQAGYKITK
jgi:hypothetical protein